jgi:hypothetical protein
MEKATLESSKNRSNQAVQEPSGEKAVPWVRVETE